MPQNTDRSGRPAAANATVQRLQSEANELLADVKLALLGAESDRQLLDRATRSYETHRRAASPSPSRAPAALPLSPWRRGPPPARAPQPASPPADPLARDDEFWRNVAEFRRVHAGELAALPALPAAADPPPPAAPARAAVKTSANSGYVYDGFYRLDERLFPERAGAPRLFLYEDDAGSLGFGARPLRVRPLHADEPPVKVSVPSGRLAPATGRRYRPHRRRSFDPADSNNLGAHLCYGYGPLPGSRRGRSSAGAPMSLQSEPLVSAQGRSS